MDTYGLLSCLTHRHGWVVVRTQQPPDDNSGRVAGLVSMAEAFSVISANLGRCSKDTLESRNLKCLDEEPQAEEALVARSLVG